ISIIMVLLKCAGDVQKLHRHKSLYQVLYLKNQQTTNKMTFCFKVYDSKGLLISCGRDLCDCLDVDCMGCFYPCPECGSRKCGVECRCDRKWLYEQVEVEGGEIIRNKFAS
uniref:ADP-ribosylation factor-like 14 effector protein n=1 Tax=Sinocyclocheilus grahami TaxID=75366 RepID=A0A672PY41_SINGR